MIKKIFLALFILFSYNSYAQFGPQQIITTEAGRPRDVFTGDIDGDGDMDVLSANRTGDFNIAWYKNLDGLGDFGMPNVIDDDLFDEARSVYAADLDNDGDLDVLATAPFSDLVIWYENLDGQGVFSTRNIINANADGAYDVIAADIDNDGDMDVISASANGVAWYENDGLGNFSSGITIFFGSSSSITSGDIDGDGDLDIITNYAGDVIVYWMKNLDGEGYFAPPIGIAPVSPPSSTPSVFTIDIDGDNDLDVLAIPHSQRVVWYENLDGQGSFGEEQIIITGLNFSVSVFSTDLDNDGDNDILYTNSMGANEVNSIVGWHENLNGLGVFGTQQIIVNTLTSPRKVFSSDIDNDGDMDVLSASQNDDTIAWYENYTILGVEENNLDNLFLYPNPVSSILYLNGIDDTITSIEIFTILGQRVWVKTTNFSQIEVSTLKSGLYLVKIKTTEGVLVIKVMKE